MASSNDNCPTEDIIKRRLLIDGDGMGGDERKLNTLMKSYLSFVDGNDSEENNALTLKRLIVQAKQLDCVARRAHLSITVNEEAKDMFADLQDQVQREVRETKKQIINSKALLEEAAKHRKYSMEYDAVAKLIEMTPDRKITEIKRMGLQLELDNLLSRKQQLDDQLDDRKRMISQLGYDMVLLKESLEVNDDVFNNKSYNSRIPNVEVPMDLDLTSDSEPPSPATTTCTDTVENGIGPLVISNSIFEKDNSDKYEDLSESEDDEHCEHF